VTLIPPKVNKKQVPSALSFRKSQSRGNIHKGVALLQWIFLLLSSTPQMICSLDQYSGLAFRTGSALPRRLPPGAGKYKRTNILKYGRD